MMSIAMVAQAPAATADSQPPATFRTKSASFVVSDYGALAGWRSDRMSEAWAAYIESCRVLIRRAEWRGACERARHVDSRRDDAVRTHFEQEFALYEIREPDMGARGVITGYFEPLLNGNRTQEPPYIYPVRAIPDDLVYLDARQIPIGSRERTIPASVDGRTVVPRFDVGLDTPGLYSLEIGAAVATTADRKLRLQLSYPAIRPYPGRSRIEADPPPEAQVIAWVDDTAALYSMQIQGSGKIRLRDGSIIRVAYAEQNGHPFRPALAALGRQAGPHARIAPPLTRGLATLESSEAPTEESVVDDEPVRSIRVRRTTPHGLGAVAPKPSNDAEVQRMIELLRPRASVSPIASSAPDRAGIAPSPDNATPSGAPNTDPSYVFFRRIPDNDRGPIGALGVPLTPGRSVAIDPRTTPLGAPVFISTGVPTKPGAINRLMLAQDTGGAIRGAVRADYFFGFGARAGASASRMKEIGQMWLLLPRNLQLPALARARTRGGLGTDAAEERDCVIPDSEFCVEE